jgi:cell division protein FtsB
MLMRIAIAVIVVVSIVVFANSVMKYNELTKEEEKLEAIVSELRVLREELIITAGSAEKLSEILQDYEQYKLLMSSDTELGSKLMQLEMMRIELDMMLSDPEVSDYIKKIAREKLGLYFPDEEIFYTNIN